jgi:hypothetical protein
LSKIFDDYRLSSSRGILQGVLILRARRAPADIDVLRRLQKQCGALHLGELRAQSPDDLLAEYHGA